jgi:RNA polymerase sigma-70 factor, ECF subfamily
MDEKEFTALLRTHGDVAYRMAYHLTRGNEALSRDLVQEGFIKIWKNWSFHRPGSFKGWLYRILRNLYMDHLRRKAREASWSLDGPTAEDSFAETYPENRPHSLELLEKKEAKELLEEALQRLPEEFRIPMVLCDIERLSYADISRILSCPIGTVRSRIHRGRLLLRRILDPHAKGELAPAGEKFSPLAIAL